jgi:hypothetical protein
MTTLTRALSVIVAASLPLVASAGDLPPGADLQPAASHVDQAELNDLVRSGKGSEAFHEAFEDGDELFETVFHAVDGVGANVGKGERFTRTPRADLAGPGEWARHVPSRETGPNAATRRWRWPARSGSGSRCA